MGRDRGDRWGEGASELDAASPYLALAREIQREVEAVVEDPEADGEALVEAIKAVPARERSRMIKTAFERLPAERQWEILEAAFGDDEIRSHLERERAAHLDALRRSSDLDALVTRARATSHLDLRELPSTVQLAVGLFRPSDVRAALRKGHLSDSCARILVVRPVDREGGVRVIDDSFNPRGGLFVTAEYDEATWSREQIPSHTVVRLGSIAGHGGDRQLEPLLYAGARVDVEISGEIIEGQLHLGFAMLGDRDVFSGLG